MQSRLTRGVRRRAMASESGVSGAAHLDDLLPPRGADRRLTATLLGITVDLTSSLEPEHVARRLLVRAVAVVNAHRGAFLTIDADGLTVRTAYDVDGGDHMVGCTFRRQPAFDEALARRRPVVDGVWDFSEVTDPTRPLASEVAHSIVLPIVRGDAVSAVVVVARRTEPAFTARDLSALEIVGTVASMALRNADAYQRLQSLEKEKSDFLRLASHELRGPLTVALGYTSMLQAGALGVIPEPARHLVGLIEGKVTEAHDIVDDIVEAVRLEDGAIDLPAAIVDLASVARAAVERVGVEHPGRQVVLSGDTGVISVRGHQRRLGIVVHNLLDNAVKYSPGGGTVECHLRVDDGHALVEIIDEGVGIDPLNVPLLFSRFGRIVTVETRDIPGTGLGLYLSRELARLHGGDISVTSAVGVGSTFTLTLPRATGTG